VLRWGERFPAERAPGAAARCGGVAVGRPSRRFGRRGACCWAGCWSLARPGSPAKL